MLVQPSLHVDGRCEEAIKFYAQAVGVQTEMLMRYKECPEAPPPAMSFVGTENWVMHASFRLGDRAVMASNDCSGKHSGFAGFQLSLSVADTAEAEQRFAALAQGRRVKMPLTKTFFSPSFGMLTDRFGVSWMVIVFSPAGK